MPKNTERKRPESQKPFWLIFLAIVITLIVSLIGVLLFQIIPHRH